MIERDLPSTSQDPARKTWIVQPGQTLRVPAEQALVGDLWECRGKGGSAFTQPPGTEITTGGLTLGFDMEGNVTARCER
jgi:hypothetical protein